MRILIIVLIVLNAMMGLVHLMLSQKFFNLGEPKRGKICLAFVGMHSVATALGLFAVWNDFVIH